MFIITIAQGIGKTLMQRGSCHRIGITLTAATVIGGSVAGPVRIGYASGESKAPFAATSFWNQKLPALTPLDTDSPAKVAALRDEITRYYNSVTINTTNYSPAVYVVGADVKPQKVAFNNCQNKSWTDPSFIEQMSAVPIPAHAQAAGGTDAEMVIYQPSTDTLWELWVARKAADGSWNTCWGGRMTGVSKSDGIFPAGYGTTATGLPFLGGMITLADLKAGRIDHALGIATVLPVRGHVWPANRNDGWTNEPHGMVEGTRLRLDPKINVDNLNLSPVAKMVARAAQDYGFVIWDKAGSVSLRAENPASITALGGTDPYGSYFGGKANWQVMEGFPWQSLQVLPPGYGDPSQTTPSPVPSTSHTPTPIRGDLNRDGKVDVLDLSRLLTAWGANGADLNGDGTTNVIDLSILLSAWK